ncbi:MAG: mechanosensitive ion channel [Candidatus Gracilibacteria bacterium]|nr:mechanosensitive ion channel [Candidatus Gracilibacteria bacterium]
MKKIIYILLAFLSFVNTVGAVDTSSAGQMAGDTGSAAGSNASTIIFSFLNRDFLLGLISAIVAIIATFFLQKYIEKKLEQYLIEKSGTGEGKAELYAIIIRTTNISVWAIGIITALSFMGVDLAIFMGGIGLGVGFALQTFLSNFLSGIIMVLSGSYKNGDTIEIAGKVGKIKKIDTFSTTVEQFDGIRFFVPNVDFLKNMVENYNANDRRRTEIEIGLEYGSDIVKAKTILLKIVDNFPNILKEPAPKIIVNEFGDNSINVKLWYWTLITDKTYFSTRSNVMETINLAFKQNDISIPFPQIVLNQR